MPSILSADVPNSWCGPAVPFCLDCLQFTSRLITSYSFLKALLKRCLLSHGSSTPCLPNGCTMPLPPRPAIPALQITLPYALSQQFHYLLGMWHGAVLGSNNTRTTMRMWPLPLPTPQSSWCLGEKHREQTMPLQRKYLCQPWGIG